MERDFEVALESFVKGCARIAQEQGVQGLPATEWSIDVGPKYVRVVRASSGSRSVHCFVSQANGDVLKAAGWKAPAKHARGNIFDASNGLGSMGPYGPAYLRR